MDQYHGTDKVTANEILANGIDVSKGGGELGQGFYTGNYEWEAFNWNWHKYDDKGTVIKFDIEEDPFWRMDVKIISVTDGMAFSKSIKSGSETRTYRFNCDVVWSSFFGYIPKSFNGEQMKFESKDSEYFLNGGAVIKTFI